MLSFSELSKPRIDIELYGADTNIAPIDKVLLWMKILLSNLH